MKKEINRRRFMKAGSLSAAGILLTACNTGKQPPEGSGDSEMIREPDAMTISKNMPPEQVFQLLDQKVNHYMDISHNCAQTSFLALSEQFGLGNEDMVKALTPLPGIAERGETCGAVTGALLALGLVFGRTNLRDWDAYRKSLTPANEFCDRFAQEEGSIMCSEIVASAFGDRLDLRKEEDLAKFQESGTAAKCSKVVRTAVRIAADIILKA